MEQSGRYYSRQVRSLLSDYSSLVANVNHSLHDDAVLVLDPGLGEQGLPPGGRIVEGGLGNGIVHIARP